MLDGRPAPLARDVFISVWSDLQRESMLGSTYLHERHKLNITISIKSPILPFDRLIQHRRTLELRANHVRSLIAPDWYDYRITRAAMTLAGFSWLKASALPVGWQLPLRYMGMDVIREVDPSWWHSHLDSKHQDGGLVCVLRFGGAERIQKLVTVS
jgi:hypothetical protein